MNDLGYLMPAGRNRTFDKQNALESAMHVFWKNGYPGTSLSDLTSEMGINKPSLYAAFGNKEKLFEQAVEYYLGKHGLIHLTHLHEENKTLKERLKNYLQSIAKMQTTNELPGGCFICNSTSEIDGSSLPKNCVKKIKQTNANTREYLTTFFEAEINAGTFIHSFTAKLLADYMLNLQFGLAISAKNGNSYATLQGVITVSLSLFDE